MLISHVEDWLISGTDAFIAYSSRRLGNEYIAKCHEGGESIYLGVEIKNAPNEFIGGGDISGGPRTFPGATLSAGNYEGAGGGPGRDISILPRRAQQKDEPLNEEEQFALRSEVGEINADCPNFETGRIVWRVIPSANFRRDWRNDHKSDRFRRSCRRKYS